MWIRAPIDGVRQSPSIASFGNLLQELTSGITATEFVQVSLSDDSRRELCAVDHRFDAGDRPSAVKKTKDLSPVNIPVGRNERIE